MQTGIYQGLSHMQILIWWPRSGLQIYCDTGYIYEEINKMKICMSVSTKRGGVRTRVFHRSGLQVVINGWYVKEIFLKITPPSVERFWAITIGQKLLSTYRIGSEYWKLLRVCLNIVVAKNKGIKSITDKMLRLYHCYANRCKQEKIKLIMIILIYGDRLFLHWLTIHGCVHDMD